MMDSVNYYGSLCTEMYELLHSQAPQDELAFYLSYAHPGDRVLELLCGSGRFLVPFVQRGFDITGVDLSQEMLEKLLQKYPAAKVHRCSADAFESEERFDYIFISSGSVSLFTDPALCQRVLQKAHDLLAPGGVFVFAVDTVSSAEQGDGTYQEVCSRTTPEGQLLKLKMNYRYDGQTQIQHSPSIYELWDGEKLLQSEQMDFQTRLYQLGELDRLLDKAGFASWQVYDRFDKHLAQDSGNGMLLYECR